MVDSLSVSALYVIQPQDFYGVVDTRGQEPQLPGMKRAEASQSAGLPGTKSTDTSKGDIVQISPEGRAKAKAAANGKPTSSSDATLTPEQVTEVQELADTDRKVRVHEQAHVSAGGALVKGGPHYSFRTGPDGKRYAVGGEVDIDTSPVKGDLDATIRKASRIQAAALAPAEPSPQDRAVAARAAKMAIQAQMDKNTLKAGKKA
jgi:hypothetical protein